MSGRLTFHAADGNLAVKFDGKAIPAGKLPAMFDLLAADMERQTNQLLAAGDHRQISRCIPINGVTMREGSTPSRGIPPCPRCGYCRFVEDADMDLAGVCPECRGEGRAIILHNVKEHPTADAAAGSHTQTNN